jgi:PAS domain S-box-containing protein
MNFRRSLSAKVLVLVALPLLIQLTLLGWLAFLENAAEAELDASNRAREISDAINVLSKDIYEGVSSYSTPVPIASYPGTVKFKKLVTAIREDYRRLEEASVDKPDLLIVIHQSSAGAEEALTAMVELAKTLQEFGSSNWGASNPAWHRLHDKMAKINYQQIVDIGREQRSIADKGPARQANIRKQMQLSLIAGSLITIAVTVWLAVYLTRGITGRLERLKDNALRLAGDMPLNPIMEGNDDIASLDRVFHRMAFELTESARKERAVFDNARDFICSLDKDGRITDANPAVFGLLGYEPSDMVGRIFVDLVAPQYVQKALDFVSSLKQKENQEPLELQMRRRDHSFADVLWSARWSQDEKKVFSIIHDITDRRQSERLQQEVIAMVTHDLRTPLFTIQNILGFLSEGVVGKVEDRLVNYIAVAGRNVERMMRLINDLLDSEKVTAEAMQPDLQSVNLAKSFQLCEESVKALAEEIGVTIDFAPTDIVVKADEAMLERILFNLAANAIKFSPRGSAVNVTAVKEGALVHVVVADDGPGIPDDQLGTIFERFRQGSSKAAKLQGSSGLGLSICKSFVELHQGKIWVESEVGHGSKFHFTLSLADG